VADGDGGGFVPSGGEFSGGGECGDDDGEWLWIGVGVGYGVGCFFVVQVVVGGEYWDFDCNCGGGIARTLLFVQAGSAISSRPDEGTGCATGGVWWCAAAAVWSGSATADGVRTGAAACAVWANTTARALPANAAADAVCGWPGAVPLSVPAAGWGLWPGIWVREAKLDRCIAYLTSW